MEFTIGEIQTMLNIVSAVVANSQLDTSTVYNIDDFDISTMEKWIAYWKQIIDSTKPTKK